MPTEDILTLAHTIVRDRVRSVTLLSTDVQRLAQAVIDLTANAADAHRMLDQTSTRAEAAERDQDAARTAIRDALAALQNWERDLAEAGSDDRAIYETVKILAAANVGWPPCEPHVEHLPPAPAKYRDRLLAAARIFAATDDEIELLTAVDAIMEEIRNGCGRHTKESL